MKLVKAITLVLLVIASHIASAGTMFDGWGEDPEKAMVAAMTRASEKSAGGCVCKGWSPNINDICQKAKPELGGFTCSACGSNHKGSCESQAELDRIVRDAGKLLSVGQK